MLDVVTARDNATITYNYRSWRNYTRAKLAGKCYALDSLTRQSMRVQSLNTSRRLGIETPNAERNQKVRYRKPGG